MTTPEDERFIPPWEIFISHSARDEKGNYTSVAGRILEGLEAVLKSGFDLLIDKCLPIGLDWDPAIRCWLARCDGAIILLDRKALASEWVKRESCILVQCRALHPDFVVLPVLIDIEPEELKGILFEDLLLMQSLKNSPSVIDHVSVLLRTKCHGRRPGVSSAMSAWIDNIAAQLPPSRRQLKIAAHCLDCVPNGISTGPLVDVGDREWLAGRFLDVKGPVSELYKLSGAIGGMFFRLDEAKYSHLAKLIVPICVDEEKSYPLLPHPDRNKEKRLVLLPASETVSAECYIERAMCAPDPSRGGHEVLGSRNGAETDEEIYEDVKNVMDELVGTSPSSLRPDRLYFLIIPRGDMEIQRKSIELVYKRCPLVTVLKLVHVDDVAAWRDVAESNSWQVIELDALADQAEEDAIVWARDLKHKILGQPER